MKALIKKLLRENFSEDEVFGFRGMDYVINHPNPDGLSAYKIINSEKVELIDLTPEEVKQISSPLFLIRGKEGEDKIMNSNINNPVIIATINGMGVLIDGNHRAAKAARENIGIKAYLLNPMQTKRIETDSIDPLFTMLQRGLKEKNAKKK
jgi:hypothetical protein